MNEENRSERYREMKRYVGWTPADAHRVRALQPLAMRRVGEIIDDFYDQIQRHDGTRRILTGDTDQIERLKSTLRQWLEELLGGSYEQAYMERRWRVGRRHVELGLPQRFVSLALARLRDGLSQVLRAEWDGPADALADALASLQKLIDVENALIQDAYEHEYVERERLAERERSEQKFRHLVEAASCIILIVRPNQEVAYVNPFAVQFCDGCQGDSAGQDASFLQLLDDGEISPGQRLQSTIEDGAAESFETTTACKRRTSRCVLWNLRLIDPFDDGPAVLAVGHDVTEQKEAAAKVLQASRLATIGEMNARLAHECRNALQRMQSCSELLADQLHDMPEVGRLLDRLQRAQADLQRLLDEVRSYASTIVLDRSVCRVATLWREAWKLLHVSRNGREIELVEANVDEQLEADVDRFRMVQVFRNVFENSLAACSEPIRLEVSCSESTCAQGRRTQIVIRDNGPGFSDEASELAFKPFFTTKSSGTGLGLAIVRRIVEAHGGDASAESHPRGGAVVAISLPRDPTP